MYLLKSKFCRCTTINIKNWLLNNQYIDVENLILLISDAHGVVKELVFPKALDLDRPKRARTTFSNEQLYHLEREFHRNQYLVGRERTELARTLGLSETQVCIII